MKALNHLQHNHRLCRDVLCVDLSPYTVVLYSGDETPGVCLAGQGDGGPAS